MRANIETLKEINKNKGDKKIVLLKGTFDLFHSGHLYMIKKAKSYGDILVVIIKPNYAVKLKGNDRPIIDENERLEIVDSIKDVDYVVLADETIDINSNSSDAKELQTERYYKIVENLKPDVLVHPTNHSISKKLLDLYKVIGTSIIEVQREGNQSTTNIINKINQIKE